MELFIFSKSSMQEDKQIALCNFSPSAFNMCASEASIKAIDWIILFFEL